MLRILNLHIEKFPAFFNLVLFFWTSSIKSLFACTGKSFFLFLKVKEKLSYPILYYTHTLWKSLLRFCSIGKKQADVWVDSVLRIQSPAPPQTFQVSREKSHTNQPSSRFFIIRNGLLRQVLWIHFLETGSVYAFFYNPTVVFGYKGRAMRDHCRRYPVHLVIYDCRGLFKKSRRAQAYIFLRF